MAELDTLRTKLDDLPKNAKRYLGRWSCGFCDAPMTGAGCCAIYEKCSVENRLSRLEKCLAEYKPRPHP